MCQSQTAGGKRCAAHTRPSYENIMDGHPREPAPGRSNADHEAAFAFRVDHGMEGIIDYASTRSGMEHVRADYARLEAHYATTPSATKAEEMHRQGTLSVFRCALRQAEARNEAQAAGKVAVGDAQAQYRALFKERNDLQTSMYQASLTAEDTADAYEISEMNARLAAVNAEMETMETWRRQPTATASSNGSQPTRTANGMEISGGGDDSPEEHAAYMNYMENQQKNMPEPTEGYDEDGWYVNAAGDQFGVCTDCDKRTPADDTCCPSSEVIATPAFAGRSN